MKKSLSIIALYAAGALATPVSAQFYPTPSTGEKASIEEVLKYDRFILHPTIPLKAPSSNAPAARAATNGNTAAVVLADSYYDLMTNAAIDDRTIKNADGSITATYIWSSDQGPAYNNRGTGYSYYSSGTWSAKPTARIENERTGWPSVMTLGNGSEVIIAHATTSKKLIMSTRPVKGTGTWTPTLDPTGAVGSVGNGYLLWPRAANGGSDGNTIHMIALSEPSGGTFSGSRYAGMDGCLLYNRSKDGGKTWDIKHQVLKGIDTTAYDDIGGDAYSITAKGNTIAIAVYHRFGHVTVLKSTDNGDSWTIHRPLLFRYNRFNLGDYKITDTVETSDNTGDVLIDNNGKLHVFFGSWKWLDDDITDSVYTVFRFDNGLHYWKEGYGDGNHIRLQGIIDQDGNPNGLSFVSTNPIADYGSKALNSAPSAGIDLAGNIYVLFHGVMESGATGPSGKPYNFNNLHYRHQFVMKSMDGGCTWGAPKDFTDQGSGYEECVYGAMATDVDSKIRFTYMEDINPGTAVGPVAHTGTSNQMLYVEEPVSSIPSNNYKCVTVIKGDRELCPGDSVYLDASGSCGSAYSWSSGSSASGIWVKTAGKYKCTITTKCGAIVDSAVVRNPIGGIGPKISLSADDNAICPSGSSTVLRLQTGSIGTAGSISWGGIPSGQVDTNVVTSPGTYNVEVINCNGDKSTANIIVAEIKSAEASVTGRAFICPGDSSVLTAAKNPAGSYTWTFNSNVISNDISINAKQTGRYYLLATACAGLYQDTTSIYVDVEPTVTASITPQGPTVLCEKSGESLTLIASGQNGATFKWSTGKTGPFLAINTDSVHTASYSVTSYNTCGDSISTSIPVEVKAAPIAPVITYSEGVFTSNNANSIWYYKEGSFWKAAGQTGLTYAPTNLKNGMLVAAIIESNGCKSENSNLIAFTVGINAELGVSTSVQVFPNPNNGEFNLRFEGLDVFNANVVVTSVVGQVVYTNEFPVVGTTDQKISLNNVESGVYFLTVENGSSKVTKQIVIE